MAVLDSLEVSPIEILADDLEIQWFSGTGKGGQNRNKTQNCCRVIHLPTGLQESRQGRSREANKREAKAALQIKLRQVIAEQGFSFTDKVRKTQIGSGYRGDKIRTYRAQDDTVIDHRTGKKAPFGKIMKGRFDLLWR